MSPGLERIAAKVRQEPQLCFTSLAHHIDATRLWQNLCHVPPHTAPGSDGQTVDDLKQEFVAWSEATLRALHTQGYRPPPVRRTYIPKPGKQERRPLGVPCIGDRVLQRSVADVLTAIYEQDFLPCSFGGRPGLGAHHALATLHEVIAGKPVSWVYEADLRNFFGSLDHVWLLRFVQHRVGDPRILRVIQRWLKAGVLEDGVVEPSDEGVPQGGNISVVLSNLYLHYALDLWFERVVKPRLPGEAYLIRYIDDFVVCFPRLTHNASSRCWRSVWRSSPSRSSRRKPVWWPSVALRSGTPNGTRDAERRLRFSVLPSTAHATTEGTSRWDGERTRRACGAVWPNSISCCRLFAMNH